MLLSAAVACTLSNQCQVAPDNYGLFVQSVHLYSLFFCKGHCQAQCFQKPMPLSQETDEHLEFISMQAVYYIPLLTTVFSGRGRLQRSGVS